MTSTRPSIAILHGKDSKSLCRPRSSYEESIGAETAPDPVDLIGLFDSLAPHSLRSALAYTLPLIRSVLDDGEINL